MKETTLYFVRHGETDPNRQRIMQGRRVNAPLNRNGRMQADALAQRFSDIPLNAIYSSSLLRAIETADAVARRHPHVPRYRLDGLDEMCWGVFEGEPWSDRLQAMLTEMYARWDAGDYDYRVEEGESIYDVQRRCSSAVEQILEQNTGGNILVVSHGRLLRVLLATILDVGLDRMDEFHHANTCVNVITHYGSNFEASLLNCTIHLREANLEMVD